MIQSTDDGVLRTHDDAEQLLRYCVTGAKVRVFKRPLKRWDERVLERGRTYEITVAPHGRETLAVLGSYSLPVRAEQLAMDARKQVESALAAQ